MVRQVSSARQRVSATSWAFTDTPLFWIQESFVLSFFFDFSSLFLLGKICVRTGVESRRHKVEGGGGGGGAVPGGGIGGSVQHMRKVGIRQ